MFNINQPKETAAILAIAGLYFVTNALNNYTHSSLLHKTYNLTAASACLSTALGILLPQVRNTCFKAAKFLTTSAMIMAPMAYKSNYIAQSQEPRR